MPGAPRISFASSERGDARVRERPRTGGPDLSRVVHLVRNSDAASESRFACVMDRARRLIVHARRQVDAASELPAQRRAPPGPPLPRPQPCRGRPCETLGHGQQRPVEPRPRALRGGHRHRGPLPAQDGVEDVLRLLERLRRRAEHPRLPGLPRAARHPPGDQPQGRRARPRDGRRDQRGDTAGDALGPQELLLPGPPEGLPDQPVRPAARLERAADVRDLGRRGHDPDHPRAPRGGHRQAHPRHRRRRAAGQPRRLQPVGRPADGDRH